jgi:hypothetical protein
MALQLVQYATPARCHKKQFTVPELPNANEVRRNVRSSHKNVTKFIRIQVVVVVRTTTTLLDDEHGDPRHLSCFRRASETLYHSNSLVLSGTQFSR